MQHRGNVVDYVITYALSGRAAKMTNEHLMPVLYVQYGTSIWH